MYRIFNKSMTNEIDLEELIERSFHLFQTTEIFTVMLKNKSINAISTHITFILETVISTMQFWGYNTTFIGDGSIKARKDRFKANFFINK
ncbi:hypothetical protein LCGC14_2335200 [marine sediment metagenome]|uniref:Uncharacterized protein n=1 Tax=marine sediment metagenome TaxID=412755 RepID=A0A0F9D146_9ZZZZ